MKKIQITDLLSNDEKQELRDRILRSARLVGIRKRNRRLLMAAASVALLIGMGIFFQFSTEPTLEDYVETVPDLDIRKADGITLILGSGDNVNLDEENAKIQYSNTGEEIQLGSGKTVNQNSIKNDKPLYNTLLVPYGMGTNLRLSDGTMVWINSGSKLVYPVVFNGESREVYLEGEAIFEVTHNAKKPFKVLSGNQEIEVLGTVFNVCNYRDDILMYTVLKSGSVKISYSNEIGKTVTLKPGTLASFNPLSDEVLIKEVNVNDYFSWREGFLHFRMASLESVMTKLSRYYNVEITIDNKELSNETFSGNLDLKENVEQVIKIIGKTSNFKADFNNGKIIISI